MDYHAAGHVWTLVVIAIEEEEEEEEVVVVETFYPFMT